MVGPDLKARTGARLPVALPAAGWHQRPLGLWVPSAPGRSARRLAVGCHGRPVQRPDALRRWGGHELTVTVRRLSEGRQAAVSRQTSLWISQGARLGDAPISLVASAYSSLNQSTLPAVQSGQATYRLPGSNGQPLGDEFQFDAVNRTLSWWSAQDDPREDATAAAGP